MKTLKITLVFMLLASSLMGQTKSSGLQDLIDLRGSSAEMDLQNRGYVHIKTAKSGYSAYSYWWNPTQRKCVCSKVSDGRVQSILNATPFDCNQNGNNSNQDMGYHNSNYNSHQAHHHQDNNYNHYDNNSHDSAFERGYNDGLYNHPYHSIYTDSNQISAYSKGYGVGVTERANQSSYHSGQGGNATHIDCNDLDHMVVSSAYSKMRERGFQETRNYKDGDHIIKAWYNSRTKQCVKTTEKNGKILGVKMNSDQCR